jgi:hypothetical protein
MGAPAAPAVPVPVAVPVETPDKAPLDTIAFPFKDLNELKVAVDKMTPEDFQRFAAEFDAERDGHGGGHGGYGK